MLFVLVATTFPMISEASGTRRSPSGPPYYNVWVQPIGLDHLHLDGSGHAVRVEEDERRRASAGVSRFPIGVSSRPERFSSRSARRSGSPPSSGPSRSTRAPRAPCFARSTRSRPPRPSRSPRSTPPSSSRSSSFSSAHAASRARQGDAGRPLVRGGPSRAPLHAHSRSRRPHVAATAATSSTSAS
jgi:hypothetical protein